MDIFLSHWKGTQNLSVIPLEWPFACTICGKFGQVHTFVKALRLSEHSYSHQFFGSFPPWNTYRWTSCSVREIFPSPLLFIFFIKFVLIFVRSRSFIFIQLFLADRFISWCYLSSKYSAQQKEEHRYQLECIFLHASYIWGNLQTCIWSGAYRIRISHTTSWPLR